MSQAAHRFRMGEGRRRHLENQIRQHHCNVSCTTERTGNPHTLVCTKNQASYEAHLRTFRENQGHLATVRAIQARLPR